MPWVTQAEMRRWKYELDTSIDDMREARRTIADLREEKAAIMASENGLRMHASTLNTQLSHAIARTDKLIDAVVQLKLAGATAPLPSRPQKDRPDPDQLALNRADNEFIAKYLEDAIAANPDLDRDAVADEARRIRRDAMTGIPG